MTDIKAIDKQYVANTYARFPVELVSRDTTRLTSPDGKAVSGGGSDRVISLSGEKSKTDAFHLRRFPLS